MAARDAATKLLIEASRERCDLARQSNSESAEIGALSRHTIAESRALLLRVAGKLPLLWGGAADVSRSRAMASAARQSRRGSIGAARRPAGSWQCHG